MSENEVTQYNNNNANNTLSTFTEADAKTVFNATSTALSLNDHVGAEIEVKGAFLVPGVRRGFDGAPDKPCVNTYIVATDGTSFFSQSSGVARDMQNIISLNQGNIEGIHIRVGERAIDKNRSMKFVEWL